MRLLHVNIEGGNMKKSIFILSIFLCASLVSACNQAGQKESDLSGNGTENIHKVAANSAINEDEIVLSLDENTQVNAEVSIPESLQNMKMNLVKAHRPTMKEEDVRKLFATEINVNKKVMDKGYKSRELGEYDIALLYGKQGEFMEVSPTDIYFHTPDYDFYLNCLFTDPAIEGYNLSRFSLTKELPFASRENVFQVIKNYFDMIGVSISDDYEAYSLNHKKLQKEEKPMDADGKILEEDKKESWTKKDDAYYFIFHQEVDGVPIRQVQYGDGFQGTGIEQTELMAIYGARGMIAFREYWGYVLEKTTEGKEIISLDRALESLQMKYDMLLTEDSTLFDEIALELMPVFIKDNEYEIHPIWSFRGQIQVEGWQSSDIEILFDGFNGKEITS